MTRNILCILIFIVSISSSIAQDSILKLPMIIEEGYGPFGGGLGSFRISDTVQRKTDLIAKGFPSQWKNVQYGSFETDIYQWTYQNYKQGKATEERYKERQKSWNWTPDEKALSATPIKCYVHCAWNIDENGHMREVILDANNNLDFSDDTIFIAPAFKDFSFEKADKNLKYFKAQQFKDGKITDVTFPITLVLSPPYVLYSIPIYGKAVLQDGKSSYKFAVSSSSFSRTDFSYTQMLHVKNYKKKAEADNLPVNQGEYLTLGNKTYKYVGVDLQKMTLNLAKVNNSSPLYSAQAGYYAFPFTDKELKSGEAISLEKYKGKYVFIDFWGTWCKPCVDEIPNVKKAYSSIDSNKIAFLSIANDKPERIKEFITTQQINWPQLVCPDAHDGILKLYNITSYPTTLLINPEGKIIAKNLRGEDLDKKLAKLIEKQ